MAKPKQTVVHISSGAEPQRLGFAGRMKAAANKTVDFFRETYVELKRVRWPKRKEVVNYTVAALAICLIMGLLVWLFDAGVAKLMSLFGMV
ncbi:MAG: preprotein translocase subunit SecE [Alicyclobacillus sp.]|nr:preprotein translocase subunit SecE [Alicyclobacillus sp.]